MFVLKSEIFNSVSRLVMLNTKIMGMKRFIIYTAGLSGESYAGTSESDWLLGKSNASGSGLLKIIDNSYHENPLVSFLSLFYKIKATAIILSF